MMTNVNCSFKRFLRIMKLFHEPHEKTSTKMSHYLISWFLSITNSWMEKAFVSSENGPDPGGCVSSCWRESDGNQKNTASHLHLCVSWRTCGDSPSSSSPDSARATVSSCLVCLYKPSNSLSSKSCSHVRSTSEVTLRKPTMTPSLCGETPTH